ncbi:MAG TPA: maleylpyruvate isomerase N-terminal domain-containing protein [Roseiflexaceae bacterium]|nr:maleylpyruvate isomerase N-terminal domain-containing protein [Roseiflexaceae bacterium]
MSETPTTVRELRARMDEGLAAFLAALDRMSEEQITGPTDAAGWTMRDHLTHLAAWADGITALLTGQDRWAAMGATPTLMSDAATSEARLDFDVINEQIAARYRGLSAAQARALVVAAHQRLAAAVDGLRDEQLAWPYRRFAAPVVGDGSRPIADYIAGDTYEHYAEHLGWMQSIVVGR